jgi:tetratricopeptide (TPR) repeat protein
VLLAAAAVAAQETETKKYSVDVKLDAAAHAAEVRAVLTLWNPIDSPKQRLQFRINGLAEIRAVTVAGQPARFEVADDRRLTGLDVVTVQVPTPIPGRGSADLAVDYRLNVATSVLDAAILPPEAVLLPSSVWVPMVSTPFAQYGPNTAPATVTVASPQGRALAGGMLSGGSFNDPLFGLPFLVAGSFDEPLTETSGPVRLEVYAPAGAGERSRSGAARLLDESRKLVTWYTSVLGAPPACTFKIIASDRGAGFACPSAIVLGPRVFQRPQLDAETYELLADALARIWIDGATGVRGATPGSAADRPRGVAVVRDALPRYLAFRALGARFGLSEEAAAYERARTTLAQLGNAASIGQLTLLTPFDPPYRAILTSKGPIALRLVEREAGRDAILAALRDVLGAARNNWLTMDAVRAAITRVSGRDLAPVYATWLDTVVEPDLVVGQPQQTPSGYVCALRNLGTGDIEVDVRATSSGGATATVRSKVPSDGFGEARFDIVGQIVEVELDPDHLIPQSDYSNDTRPLRPSPVVLLNEALLALNKKDFTAAHGKLTELLRLPQQAHNGAALALHARALLGLERGEDAARVAREVIALAAPPSNALAWAHVVLGVTERNAGNLAAAADHYRAAAAYAQETAALRVAREGLIATERAGGQTIPVDGAVRTFFAEFDRAVSAGVNTEQVATFVQPAALPAFVRGLVTSIARRWTTEVLRTERLDADDLLADVRFSVTSRDSTSTAIALVRLRQASARLEIIDVELLDTIEERQ